MVPKQDGYPVLPNQTWPKVKHICVRLLTSRKTAELDLGDEVTVIISETKSSNKNETKRGSMDEIIDNEQDESFEIIDVKDNELRDTEFRVSDVVIIEFKTNFQEGL